ncbi:MAG: YerC/YecD family TrpR-related protein [Firmicutes bacterium]|jgi:TrpR-related protein YerC/YecD|nr:YerC/YecD family TrpR-related protein [Bacillota bacterium]
MANEKIKSKSVDMLFEAILSLESQTECYSFFEDLCTIKELQSLSQRLEVAKLLSEKKTYLEIAKVTHASTATISRINRALEYGADGYKNVLSKIKS